MQVIINICVWQSTRPSEDSFFIIEQQLKEFKKKLNLKEWSKIAIAYEPIWND